MRCVEVDDKNEKTRITLSVMHALPKWFSPPEDIDRKATLHREFPFFAVYDNMDAIGFVALKINNPYTIDVYSLGVLEDYHGKGAGTLLVQAAEAYCQHNGYRFLTVKTLDGSANYEPYERTRSFYLRTGFLPLEVLTTFWDADNPCLFMAKAIG